VGYNWTLASTSAGWYSSLKAGSAWTLVAAAGEGVPVGKSVVWVAPNHLFTHTGSEIWLSEDRAANWELVCDLVAVSGYRAGDALHSIDGYYGRIIATCGYSLIETMDLGEHWAPIPLSTMVRSWSLMSSEEPIWRQIAFWDTLDQTDSSKSRWMVSAILTKSNLIRTFVNRGLGTFSPVVDMALSERHRLNVNSVQRMGEATYDHQLIISGDRRVNGELVHALTVSTDGQEFSDVLGGSNSNRSFTQGFPGLDEAHAELARLVD